MMRRCVFVGVLSAMACRETPVPTDVVKHVASATDWAGARESSALSKAAAAPAKNAAWVLHVGDSFVDASFQQNLRPRFRTAGTTYVSQGSTSTYTTTWAQDPQLDRWLSARPALVIVTLGANEVDIPVPEAHAKAIERLAHKIAASPKVTVKMARRVLQHLSEPGVRSSMNDELIYQTFINKSSDFAEFRAANAEGREPHYTGS